MASIRTPERIGSISNIGLSITLGPSRINIGGQQYVTINSISATLASPTANTLYMVYAVLTNGAATLVFSTNVNSVGPAGSSQWKLVGALYTNGVSGFGSFVNITGVPTTGEFDLGPVPVSAVTTPPVKPTMTRDKIWGSRNGDKIFARIEMLSAGTSATPGVGDYLFGPGGFTIDTSKVISDTTTGAASVDKYPTVGTAICAFQGTQSGSGTVRVYNSSFVRLFAGPTATGIYQPVGQNSNNNFWNVTPIMYSAEFRVPILGWTNTQLVDL